MSFLLVAKTCLQLMVLWSAVCLDDAPPHASRPCTGLVGALLGAGGLLLLWACVQAFKKKDRAHAAGRAPEAPRPPFAPRVETTAWTAGAGLPAGLAALATSEASLRGWNEDACGMFPRQGLFAVAGCIGAWGPDEPISVRAIATLREHFETTPAGASRLAEGIHRAHQRLVEQVRVDQGRSGNAGSLAVLALGPEGVQVSHVGECRVHRVRDGHLEPLTQDHTFENEAARFLPDIDPAQREQYERFVRENKVLTRSLGMKSFGAKEGEALDFDVQRFALRPGALYLLSTRGLHTVVPPDELLDILRTTPELETAARALVDRAFQRKGLASITCLLVRLE
ncbi:PP2C family protein-serine/threonine phosphatase [Melittangium boletus]|uniref:PP2C family protein-serine/threonine phosphatase n=1 Tax=Melittangium boletus TaxID=83453 RepID=UPI003DA1DBD4